MADHIELPNIYFSIHFGAAKLIDTYLRFKRTLVLGEL